jgi:hypothetical protein
MLLSPARGFKWFDDRLDFSPRQIKTACVPNGKQTDLLIRPAQGGGLQSAHSEEYASVSLASFINFPNRSIVVMLSGGAGDRRLDPSLR